MSWSYQIRVFARTTKFGITKTPRGPWGYNAMILPITLKDLIKELKMRGAVENDREVFMKTVEVCHEHAWVESSQLGATASGGRST